MQANLSRFQTLVSGNPLAITRVPYMTAEPSAVLEHTLAEIARLDLLIRREVVRVRLQQGQREDDEFRGLYVFADEVDALLDRSLSTSAFLTPQIAASDQLATLDAAVRPTVLLSRRQAARTRCRFSSRRWRRGRRRRRC
jgi:hypothetical protein